MTLFQPCSPPAIGRLVVAGWIWIPVDGQPFPVAIGACPITEWHKSLPFWAQGDALTTVVFIDAALRVHAAVAHHVVDAIQVSAGFAMCTSWRRSVPVAAAGNLPAGAKISCIDNSFLPAIAETAPCDPAACYTINDGQLPETLSRKVDQPHGGLP